jgi:hypothetical protein
MGDAKRRRQEALIQGGGEADPPHVVDTLVNAGQDPRLFAGEVSDLILG